MWACELAMSRPSCPGAPLLAHTASHALLRFPLLTSPPLSQRRYPRVRCMNNLDSVSSGSTWCVFRRLFDFAFPSTLIACTQPLCLFVFLRSLSLLRPSFALSSSRNPPWLHYGCYHCFRSFVSISFFGLSQKCIPRQPRRHVPTTPRADAASRLKSRACRRMPRPNFAPPTSPPPSAIPLPARRARCYFW